MTKFIRINEFRNVANPGLDGHEYTISFDVGEVVNGQFKSFDARKTTITTSGTLQSVWGQSDSQVAQSSANAAASIIQGMVSSGQVSDLQPIKLNTFTAPRKPPESPIAVPGALLAIPEEPETQVKSMKFSLLSEDIAEIRDQINAISNSLLGGRLLELPQERAILDVYKPATSAEEFRSRIQSLAGICVALNKGLLGNKLAKESTESTGSITLLESYLGTCATAEKVSYVCNVLKNVNELRKGFPTHTDNTDKFLAAHDFFNISYPVENFDVAWDTILGAYFRSMKQLLEILADERKKANK
jgi:hypothetical protein